eukprot:scaffold1277_cov253-Pinguiococcus_pyrenoidosus.AAC.2
MIYSVGKYNVAGCTGEELVRFYLDMSSLLYAHGFLVVATVADGAAENRAFRRIVSTETAGAFLRERKGFDLDTTLVASPHPVLGNECWVFHLDDPPHWLKKIANGLSGGGSSRRRALRFPVRQEGGGTVWHRMDIGVLHSHWRRYESDMRPGDFQRARKLSEDHFRRNSYTKMRVPMAAQLLSDSMARILRETHIEGYDTTHLEAFVRQVNRAFDIFNSDTRKPGIHYIRSPKDAHLGELCRGSPCQCTADAGWPLHCPCRLRSSLGVVRFPQSSRAPAGERCCCQER